MNIEKEAILLFVTSIAFVAVSVYVTFTPLQIPQWVQYLLPVVAVGWILWFVMWAARGGLPYAGGMR